MVSGGPQKDFSCLCNSPNLSASDHTPVQWRTFQPAVAVVLILSRVSSTRSSSLPAMLIVDAILSKKSRRGFLRLIDLSKGYTCSWEGGGLKLIEGATGSPPIGYAPTARIAASLIGNAGCPGGSGSRLKIGSTLSTASLSHTPQRSGRELEIV